MLPFYLSYSIVYLIFFSATTVTDAGPEVKCCCDSLLSSLWGWCASHMVSTGVCAVFGDDRVNLTDEMALVKDLLKRVRKLIEHYHKSPSAKTLLDEVLESTRHLHGLHPESRLAQSIHQRWASLVKSLISFLERYDALRSSHQTRGNHWTITPEERESLVEIVSILIPVRNIIVEAQANKGGLVPQIVASFTDLRLDTLCSDKDLTIIDHSFIAKQKMRKENNQPLLLEPAPRKHEDLTAIGKATRESMNIALSTGNRFFHRYTKEGACKPTKCLSVYDVLPLLHPFMKSLSFMDKINETTPGYVSATDDYWLVQHKKRVHEYFIDQMEKVIMDNDQKSRKSEASSREG